MAGYKALAEPFHGLCLEISRQFNLADAGW